MAENVDRHLNSVMILEHTFSQRLGNNKQMANISSSQHTPVIWWMGDAQFILATYRQPKDSLMDVKPIVGVLRNASYGRTFLKIFKIQWSSTVDDEIILKNR
jgi:hypothetical protein